MLESLFNPDISFPVGRVEYLVIQPASFPEFLGALGETAALQQILTVPAAAFAHDSLLKLFRTYCLIGGMPEIVAHYAAHKDLAATAVICLRGAFEGAQKFFDFGILNSTKPLPIQGSGKFAFYKLF